MIIKLLLLISRTYQTNLVHRTRLTTYKKTSHYQKKNYPFPLIMCISSWICRTSILIVIITCWNSFASSYRDTIHSNNTNISLSISTLCITRVINPRRTGEFSQFWREFWPALGISASSFFKNSLSRNPNRKPRDLMAQLISYQYSQIIDTIFINYGVFPPTLPTTFWASGPPQFDNLAILWPS